MRAVRATLVALLFITGGQSSVAAQPAASLSDKVDPLIGTLGSGFVFPGPSTPFGMVQLSPDTDGYLAYTGYLYSDQFIRGFSHHHIESMGVKSNGNLPFMPTLGPVVSTDPRVYWSRFDHATERAEAGYYSVLLESYGISAELAAGTRVGMHRYTFPPSPQSNVLLDIGRSNKEWDPSNPDASLHQSSIEIVGDDTVVGTAESDQDYTIHFAAEFDRSFDGFGVWGESGAQPSAGERIASGVGAGGYVSFDTTGDREVLVKVGISFVSRAGALLNLRTEKPDWDFDALVAKTKAQWDRALSTISVTGGTELEQTSFYTALYHAQQHPNIYSDVNGRYMGHDDKVHVARNHEHYANFSLWDTYRGENQLLATIQPDRYRNMMLSLLDIYRQTGRLPQWAMNDALPDYMVGDPVQMTVVDGYCRGVLEPRDIRPLYEALRAQAFKVRKEWDPDYLKLGWVGDGASETLEYALADFALALMADSLGERKDRDLLLDRAGNYANVIDPDSGFARPRMADGSWKEPYRPEEPDHFVEGTGWQYTWLVPHDVRGLFDLIGEGRGGDDIVRERLDTFFTTPLAEVVPFVVPEIQKMITLFGIVYAGNQYAPSNEHDLHAPYLYDYVGQPHKTQGIMRGYQGLFRATPDGLPGNDDLGSMSAWYIWSALGFYPVTGGAPIYAVGSPLFEEAVIRPSGRADAVVVKAPGASLLNKYITTATLGRWPLQRPWFSHHQLFRAGEVTFEMTSSADEEWGSDPATAPPSMSTHPLKAFACR